LQKCQTYDTTRRCLYFSADHCSEHQRANW